MRTYLTGVWNTSVCLVQKSTLPILLIFLTAVGAAAHPIPGQPNMTVVFAIVGRMHNIDPDLLEAMAEVESGGDPWSVSPRGALGLMQLMPATASTFSVLDPFDPVANVMGAADFLDGLRNRFANNLNLQGLPALLAAYNAGPGAVEKYGGIPPYPETHKYVRRVVERYTNNLNAQAAVAPALILGATPYVRRLGRGPHVMQPEPVLIRPGGGASVQYQLATLRGGWLLVARGTGAAPWIRRAAVRKPESPRH
jgi:hypothetical protein